MLKKLIKLIFIFVVLFRTTLIWADVDEFIGVSTVDEYLGISTIDEVVGQTVAGGGGGTDFRSDGNCQGVWLFADNANDGCSGGSAGVNDLTLSSAPSYETTYPSGFSTGKSMHFDGADDYLYRAESGLSADFPGLADTEDFAFCIWFKKDDDGNTEQLFSKNTDFQVRLDSGEDLDIFVDDGTNSYTWEDVADFTGLTGWYHFCFSFDGSGTQGTAWISSDIGTFGDVVDGTSPQTFTNVDFLDANSNTVFSIGVYAADPCCYFDGYLYQPIAFDRAINATDAEAIYTTGVTGAD